MRHMSDARIGAGSERPRRVVVVDDEPMVREVVATYLTHAGFRVEVLEDGRSAIDYVRRHGADLVVLDVMLPIVDGLDVLAEIRKLGDVPVILLTARTEEADRVLGLELGADDYVLKPFSPRELAARVKTVLRRSGLPAPDAGRLEFGELTIDPRQRRVEVEGRSVELTRREFELLWFMASSPGQVFSRGQLLQQVWDSSTEWQDPATVTVHIGRLRNKIEDDPSEPKRLTTVWGVGYRFEQ